MFSIKTEALIASYERFGRLYKQMIADIGGIALIRKRLGDMDGMQGAADALRAQQAKLEEQAAIMGQMILAADRIALCYTHYENGIVDSVENTAAGAYGHFKYNDLTAVRDKLKDIAFYH